MYELHYTDYDGSKLVKPMELWSLISTVQHDPFLLQQNETLDPRVSALTAILRDYTHSHRDLINIHTGIFRPRVTVDPEIERFMLQSFEAASPRKILMSGIDNIMLLYSIALVVLCVVYHSLEHSIGEDNKYDPHVNITPDMLESDILIFDGVFWLCFALVYYLFLQLTAAVADPPLFCGLAVAYSFCVYAAVAPGTPRAVVAPAVVLAGVVAVACKALSTAGFSTGFFAVIVDVVNAFLVYVHHTDGKLTFIKFVNCRFWAAIIQNACVMLMYMSSVAVITTGNTPVLFPAHVPTPPLRPRPVPLP